MSYMLKPPVWLYKTKKKGSKVYGTSGKNREKKHKRYNQKINNYKSWCNLYKMLVRLTGEAFETKRKENNSKRRFSSII